MTPQEKIERLIRNVGNMSIFSYKMSFGIPPKESRETVEGLQAFARQKLEQQDDGEYLLNIDALYDDAEGNDELPLP